jgi:hypothetical protein
MIKNNRQPAIYPALPKSELMIPIKKITHKKVKNKS